MARRPPPDGSRGGRQARCVVCGEPAAKLCDHPMAGTGPMCNSAICAGHAVRVAVDRDYCPKHAEDANEERARVSAWAKRR